MPYKIIWGNKAIESLHKLESLISTRIIKSVKEFSANPRAREFKRLKGEKAFRLRVGDYRVIFDFNHELQAIQIIGIGHRKNIYKR